MSAPVAATVARVSCIVPVYNGAPFVAQAIESIRAQQGAELEIIVVDDGSTDGSGDIAARYPGVIVSRRPQGGVAAARNAGLALATGEFVAFLDADDLWLPGKLTAQLETIGDADFAITYVRHVRTGPDGLLPPDNGEATGEEKLGRLMQCMLARRSAFDRIGPLDTRTITRADQDWFVRAAEAGLREVVVDKVLTIRRIHGSNHSLRHADQVHADFLAIAKRALDRKRQAGVAIADTPVPAFEQAAARVPVEQLRLAVGSLSIAVRVAGPKLAERLFAPLRHIVSTDTRPPDLTICAWSIGETGVPRPQGVPWTYEFPHEWVHKGDRLIVACFESAGELTRLSISRPFQWSLIERLATLGLPTLHGALVAAPGSTAGLLLVGPNGSGKSTTCLAAVGAGFGLVGEDVVVIDRRADAIVGHSLYCSCSLTRQTQAFFNDLPGPLILPYGAGPDAKSILILPADGPQSPMRRSLPIAALVFPVITGQPGPSRWARIAPEEAAERFEAALQQSKKLHELHRRAHRDAAAPLVTELPAFRLDLGADISLVPKALTTLSRSLR